MELCKIDNEYLKNTFLKYVKVNTQSDSGSKEVPSSKGQFDLGRLIIEDLHKLGIKDVVQDEHAYVIARIKGNVDKAPTIAFIAHLDTAPNVSGENVNAIVHENFMGGDIVLPKDGIVIKETDFSSLKAQKGKTVITADGSTLLGADDKAGASIIVEMARYITKNQDFKHGDLCFVFTPDEEIGHGASLLDIEKLGAKCGYTLDGSARGEMSAENFSADTMIVTATGLDIHPGYSKDKMINAIRIICNVMENLPMNARPETTELRQGFIHPISIEGGVSTAKATFIIRDFEMEGLKRLESVVDKVVAETKKKYKGCKISTELIEAYRNMRYVLDKEPKIVKYLEKAIEMNGFNVHHHLTRGGTDGARLSFRGLPCPDIFTGMNGIHGKLEWISIEDMADSCRVALSLINLWAEEEI